MRRYQGCQLFAHRGHDSWILGDHIGFHDAIKQLRLDVFTQGTFVLRIALRCELIKHVFESSG
jgi:hypothetical protein